MTKVISNNQNKINEVELTTGKIYINYNQVINSVEDWIHKQKNHIVGCDEDQIKGRIVQRLIEISNQAYVEKIAKSNYGVEKFFDGNSKISLNGVTINQSNGSVTVSFKQWFINIGMFAIFWLHFLVVVFAAIFRRSPKNSLPATFLMEGFGACDDHFIQYCKQGPISSLSSASQTIVKSPVTPKTSIDSNFHYSKHPLPYFVKTSLQRKHKVLLLWQHLKAPIVMIRALFNSRLNILLARDIAYIPVVCRLDKMLLVEAIILTTSAFPSQPLWMKGLYGQKFKLHMVWYSQNFIPKRYVGELEQSNLPSARHMRVDVHWVWTEGFKSYLNKNLIQRQAEINVVGPILWRFPEKIEDYGTAFKVAIFDITPLPDGETAYGALKNYYSVRTIKKFVRDVVEECIQIAESENKKLLLLLKHKRVVKKGSRDAGYFNFLNDLANKHENFKILEHDVNLSGLISECDFSVAVPYTSTVYVSAQLDKPAIYYDPYAELVPSYEQAESIFFASGKSELRVIVKKLFNERTQAFDNNHA